MKVFYCFIFNVYSVIDYPVVSKLHFFLPFSRFFVAIFVLISDLDENSLAMTVEGSVSALNLTEPVAACRDYYPLDQARNFKVDVDKHLDLQNFDKAMSISRCALRCVDATIKTIKLSQLELKLMHVFRSEFERFINIIIPCRRHDLQREKELERLRALEEYRLQTPSISTMDSFYCMVDPGDCASMYPMDSSNHNQSSTSSS